MLLDEIHLLRVSLTTVPLSAVDTSVAYTSARCEHSVTIMPAKKNAARGTASAELLKSMFQAESERMELTVPKDVERGRAVDGLGAVPSHAGPSQAPGPRVVLLKRTVRAEPTGDATVASVPAHTGAAAPSPTFASQTNASAHYDEVRKRIMGRGGGAA